MSSLSNYFVSSFSAPATRQISVDSDPHHPPLVSRSLSDSGHVDTGMGHSATAASISQQDLEQALSIALSNIQVWSVERRELVYFV